MIPLFSVPKDDKDGAKEIQVLSFDEVSVVMGKECRPKKDMREIRSSRGR